MRNTEQPQPVRGLFAPPSARASSAPFAPAPFAPAPFAPAPLAPAPAVAPAAAKSRSAVGLGLATLVTVLVLVLLATFSVLSLVSARADLNLSRKALESTQSYYLADAQAERWLAELDASVGGQWSEATADTLTTAGYDYALETEGEGCLVSETFPIDAHRQLSVEVAVSGEGRLTVLMWQSGPIDDEW